MPSATKAPPKSILKKTQSPTQGAATTSREGRNRETALYHAHLIQHRKDVEAQILQATETLLDYPTSPDTDPAHPSASDATNFKELLKPFQSSDYDSLIEERSIDGKCGYVLCNNLRQHQDNGGKLKILRGGRHDNIKIVPSEKLEQWCSEACARRGLYIRVQLSEEPGWVRTSSNEGAITLLDEWERSAGADKALDPDAQLADRVDLITLIDDAAHQVGSSAQSTGDPPNEILESIQQLSIAERSTATARAPRPPSTSTGADSMVEGYKPTTESNSRHRV